MTSEYFLVNSKLLQVLLCMILFIKTGTSRTMTRTNDRYKDEWFPDPACSERKQFSNLIKELHSY